MTCIARGGARRLLIIGALACFPTILSGGNASPVIFDTVGGDAWTFQKIVTGRLSRDECEQVLIRSPSGEIRAQVNGDHAFVARVPLRAGVNRLAATCRSNGHDVGQPSLQQWTVRLPDKPHATVHIQVLGNKVVLDGSATTPAPGAPSPIARYEWRVRKGNPALITLAPAVAAAGSTYRAKRLEITAPTTGGRYYITLRVTDSLSRSDETTAVFRVQDCHAAIVDTQHEHPAWADTAVVYGVALPLLKPDSFLKVTQRLDAIAALGATVIWLSPVTAAPAQDFGYALTDPFSLRAAFGSDTQLRALIAAAHARGLHVILDAVTNQLSDQSRYFVDSHLRGRSSPYYGWFARDASGRALHYFDWRNLENLSYDNPEVRSFLTAALTHWLEAYSADGFRVDAAWALRQRAPDFWPAVRRELERVNPDIWVLAEASARDPYYALHGFDAAYDWTMTIGQWAWHGIFGAPSQLPKLGALRAALSAAQAAPALHFINNNDTGKRFITQHGVDEARVAAALLFTLPGIPLIYDGDENGSAFEPYSGHAALSWNDPHDFGAMYTRLARTRHEVPALLSRVLTVLRTNHDDEVLAYARGGGRDEVVVLLNFSAQPVQAALFTGASPGPLAREHWVAADLLTGAALPASRDLSSWPLPAYGAVLLHQPRHTSPAEPSHSAHCSSGVGTRGPAAARR